MVSGFVQVIDKKETMGVFRIHWSGPVSAFAPIITAHVSVRHGAVATRLGSVRDSQPNGVIGLRTPHIDPRSGQCRR